MAFAAYLDAVQKIYIAFYQRPADPAGLRYWAQRMDAAGGDQAAVIDAFATSPEAVALYGPIDASTIGTVVDAIYLALYNRAPDADGKKFYVDGFNAGTFTPGTIALNILNGASNDDAVAIANKLVVANQFTQQVDGRALTNPDFGIGSNFNVTYAGDADAVAARDILKAVTSSPSTVLNAGEVTEVLKQKIADPTDPIQGESGGKTFTLTVGADNILGTSGNDTIDAITVNGQGTAATTLQAFDTIDGGAGTDTLNIYVDNAAPANTAQVGTIKNVEIVNIVSDAAASTFAVAGIDASKFVGATQIWQVNGTHAAGITKLASGVTAGFRDIAATALNVDVADAATSVAVALDRVDDAGASDVVVTAGAASKLASATISGTVIDDGTGNGVDDIDVTIEAGLNVKSFTFTTEVDVNLVLNENAVSTVNIESFDGSTSTGDIALTTDADLKTTKTGAGDDTVTLGADLAAAGSVITDAGNDAVDLNGNDVAANATVNLGAGNDVFADLTGGSIVDLGAVIDGGSDEDTLQLQLVGAANVVAFKNFEIFDVRGLDHDVDLDILASKNNVTKITASGAAASGAAAAGGANLENVGTGVSYEVTGDMDANAITLTQKTAGALTITSNVDEVAADAALNASDAVVVAANATSLNIVFDNNNIDKLADGYANTAQLDVTAGSGNGPTGVKGATSVAVVSGGSEVVNTLNLTAVATSAAGTAELLTSITVTGTQALVLDRVASGGTLKLASVDASGQTAGGLTFNLDDLTTTGTLKLGAGDDVITGEVFDTTAAVTTAALTTINGFKKGTAADAAKQDGFDVLKFAGATQSAAYNNVNFSVADGKVTWKGAGPANLDAAITTLEAVLQNNETVVFSLGGSEYFIFGAGASNAATNDDLLIKLTGVTSVTGLDTEAANGDLYLF